MEVTNGTKSDIDGSLSVLSMPSGMPSMFFGNGKVMIEAAELARLVEMKGWFARVVKMVTVAPRARMRRAS